MKKTDTKNRGGYVIAEILIGLIVLGIALVPFVRAVWLLPQVGSGIHSQSRTQSWRTLTDSAVTSGLDPSNAPLLNTLTDPSSTQAMVFQVTRTNAIARAGVPQIIVLSGQYANSAEPRAVGEGYEIGPSSLAAAPRTDPLPPLPPVIESAPTLTPANGSFIAVSSLTAPPVIGAPFLAQITSTAPDPANHVWLQQTAPSVRSADSTTSASLNVDAVDLARSVRGRTWTEYPGDPATDTPVPLGDGRTRWLVTVGPRVQSYDPSDFVDYAFGVDVGRPVYTVAGVQYSSGDTVPLDIAESKAIESGTSAAVIQFPAAVSGVFGNQWATVAPTFNWVFGTFTGDSSAGNTRSYFSSLMRPFWTDTQTLTATPVSSFSGISALTATWTVGRTGLALGPPDRTSSFFNGDTDQISMIDFTAPILSATGERVGRPKVDGVESAGNTVSSPLLPP